MGDGFDFLCRAIDGGGFAGFTGEGFTEFEVASDETLVGWFWVVLYIEQLQLVVFLGDFKGMLGLVGVGNFERCDFCCVGLYHINGSPKLYVGIKVWGEVAHESGYCDFAGSFDAWVIHIGGVLRWGCETHEDGMDFLVVVRENDFCAIEGDVFDHIFFGGIGHGAFDLKFRHRPEEQLIDGVGISGECELFISGDPFPIYFFKGEVGQFGVVGCDGDFIDIFGRFEGE